MTKQEVEEIQAVWRERHKGTTLSEGDPRLNEPRLCEALLEAMEALKFECSLHPKVEDDKDCDCTTCQLVRQFYGETR